MALKLDGVSQEAVLDADKVNNGIWVHFDSPRVDDEGKPIPMYLGGDKSKPQRGLVRSYRCQALKDAEAARQKAGFTKIRLAKKKDRDGVIAESSVIPPAERFAYLLVALENFSADAPLQHLSTEDAKALFEMTQLSHIVEQVNETAYEDSNYLADERTEEGNASRSAANVKPTAATPPESTSE